MIHQVSSWLVCKMFFFHISNLLVVYSHSNFILFFRASITTLGFLYERLGWMAGRSYDESVQVLLWGLKNSESQTRAESLATLEKVT